MRDYHKTTPSLHSRHWLPITVEPHQQVYGYVRYVDPAEQPVLVLLNFSAETVAAEVEAPPEFPGLFKAAALRDLLTNEVMTVQAANPVRIPLPALGARILIPAV